ncbi:MAG: hypothetical protein AAB916_02705 [Patescibacteria group bacterium]
MHQTSTLNRRPAARIHAQQEVLRDEKIWRAFAGMWRGKKVLNPVRWQKKIRKAWTRILP